MEQHRQRALLACSLLSDQFARLVLSTALPVAMVPQALGVDSKAEVKRLEYYAALAQSRDAAAVFPPPPSPIPVHARRGSGLEQLGGVVELLRFHSPYEPLHPDLRRAFRPTGNNATSHAQYWHHGTAARQTLLVIHGMSASAATVNATLFSLKSFFRDGWDIVLYTLPFHGARQATNSLFNGAELFSGGFTQLHEALAQAVCELRVLLDYLERKGAPRVGATGISLGGYMTALLAAVEDRLDFAIPNSTVADIAALMNSWWTARNGLCILERIKGLPRELVDRSLALHSPLNYPRLLPSERLLLIAGRADRVSPPEQTLALWEHWGRPELHWFPGGHIVHLQRHRYLERMRELMRAPRVSPAPPAPLPRQLRSR